MPYINGGALADRLAELTARRQGMPQREALSYLSQAAEAIDFAHAKGIVHRDVKPGNMLLRSDAAPNAAGSNWLLLADFGIAQILSDPGKVTQTGEGIGTPEYMAPEQAQGHAVAASDNYSLAVIAYYLFAGRLPFSAESSYATTIQHITMPPPPPGQFNPALSRNAEAVLLRALAKQPAERPSSASGFVSDLQHALTSAPAEVTYREPQLPTTNIHEFITPIAPEDAAATTLHQHPPVTEERKRTSGLTRRRLVVGGAALLALGGSAAAWSILSHRGSSTTNGTFTPTPNHNSTPTPNPTADPNGPALSLSGHNYPVNALAWNPGAPSLLASAGSDRDGQILLWDISKGQAGKNIQYSQRIRYSARQSMLLAWSPDGAQLAVGNGNGLGKLALLTRELQQAKGYEQEVNVADWSIKGVVWLKNSILTLADTSDLKSSQVELWDTTRPLRKLAPAILQGQVNSYFVPDKLQLQPSGLMAASPSGDLVAIGLAPGVLLGQPVVQNNATVWQNARTLTFGGNEAIVEDGMMIVWSPDGGTLAASGSNFGNNIMIALWDSKNGKQPLKTLTLPDGVAVTGALAWCPTQGSTLLAGCSDTGSVYIWDISKGNEAIRTLNGLKATITTLAWSNDGKWLAAGYNDVNASLLLWNV